MVAWYWILVAGIGALLVGAVITFFVTRKLFQKHLEDNPPINREQIKLMYMSMGRKPSEAQINQTMNAFKQGATKKSKK